LAIEKRGVPIGVIGIIFESRPNVAMDAAALCLKSGNVCILRGGSDSWQSIEVLVDIVQKGLQAAGLPKEAVQLVPSADREHVGHLLTLDQYVDVIIPRGGKSLNERVKAESRIPVLGHLEGICHTYIDAGADPAKAVAITKNAKMRRPSVCGATECLLLHKDIVGTIGKKIVGDLLDAGCEVRAPEALLSLDTRIKRSSGNDYGVEFLAPILALAMVGDVTVAVDFINKYGSQHTDAIITEDQAAADYFLDHVDSAIAIHNASTQFADGGEFGKGAEVGIATGRIQARGPVGLEELTIYQYRILGTGQIRPV
jgi:glutamate-5-semialdehyde dehydrogenase